VRVNVICRNFDEDRVLPRFARYLRDGLGWTLTKAPVPGHDVTYLMGYFETQVCREWPARAASLFTHREEADPSKARLYDQIAERVSLRVAMCRKYSAALEKIGPTIQPPLPVETDRFTPGPERQQRRRPVIGLSGYTYRTKRKGEDLARALVASRVGRTCEWKASGRRSNADAGWPVDTKHYEWSLMPEFYRSLDVLVCPSRVEGGPMPVLEALACGVKVVVPIGVGIVDEIPAVRGVCRYNRGDIVSMEAALQAAIGAEADRDDLRGAVASHTVAGWCGAHREDFEAWMS
jgi:hypothetical protein